MKLIASPDLDSSWCIRSGAKYGGFDLAMYQEGQGKDGWQRWLETEYIRCIRCKDTPLYDERHIFLDTMMCGWCWAHSGRNSRKLRA